MRYAIAVSDNIEERVNTIAEVNIRNSSVVEHDFCSLGAAVSVGVGGAIFGAGIGFGFNDNAAGKRSSIQMCAESFAKQFATDGADIIPTVKFDGEYAHKLAKLPSALGFKGETCK